MHIREYLVREAERLTAGALRSLPPPPEWEAWRRDRQGQFHEMLGIKPHLNAPRTPLNVRVTRVLERDGFRIEALRYESLPGLYVTANLYVPNGLDRPAPGVLYVCGHSDSQKAHYQDHPRRFAQLGCVTLIVDTIQLGEVRGIHHGTHRHGWFHWISRGYTPAGVEVWNAVRGLDLLEGRNDVDAGRLGMTGTSGGGAITWWTAAADDRVRVAAPSCGTATTASHVRERTIDGHCDCMFPVNLYGWSLLEMSALVAPRPLLIASAALDGIFTIDAIREFYDRLAHVYRHLDRPDDIRLVTFEGPHSYDRVTRTAIFSWFVRHLQGREVPPEQVGDIDGTREGEADLAVFPAGLPAHDESTSVQDWFVQPARPPEIVTEPALRTHRQAVIDRLRATTFAAFPPDPPPLDLAIHHRWADRNGSRGSRFSYVSEEGWRLAGEAGIPPGVTGPAPAAIILQRPGDGRRESLGLLRGLGDAWLRVRIEPRGTGETAWGAELNWHVRRAAALIGRTIASQRVFDVLRGLAAVRSLPEVDSARIALAASGEMAAVALYAALLDGHVDTLILEDPPATQDAPGRPDGTGPALEMIGVLRCTDLPQVAGLLWPTRLVFVGPRPDSYRWAEQLYRRLGAPGGIWRVTSLAEWAVSARVATAAAQGAATPPAP